MRRFAILGAPSSAGANAPGLEFSPAHLRQCGLNLALVERGASVTDYGDCEPRVYRPDRQADARNLETATAVAHDVHTRARLLLQREEFVLLLGGDCTVTIGLVAAAREQVENLGLAYLDSQTDLNTPATTDTGILDSMGLAHMLGCARNTLADFGSLSPLVEGSRVLAFGYHPDRITAAEDALLAEIPIRQYPVTEVAGRAAATAGRARTELEAACDGFILHFDIDVIDFTEFPAADAPVYRGFGLGFDDALASLATFAESKKCIGLAVTEFNPDRDRSGELGRRFVHALAKSLIPGAILQDRGLSRV